MTRFGAPNPYPPVKFIKINGRGEHEKAGGDELVTLPGRVGEPCSGDGSGEFDADVVAVLGYLAQMVYEGLQHLSGPLTYTELVDLGHVSFLRSLQ